MKVLKVFVFCLCVNYSLSEETCTDFGTCGACLGFPGDQCVWCSAPDVNNRCRSTAYHLEYKNWCKEEFASKPKPQNISGIVDKPLGPADGNKSAVQFRPQNMAVKLGPGQEITFQMSFKHAKHFPLDVYFLMDYSHTMENHVQALKRNAEFIKTYLTNFTNNVYFGVGSFVDKPAYPFAGDPSKSYSFRHHLNLTSNMESFVKSLYKNKDLSNFDPPEAGLDALMQVMACERELGWRPNANRIIILFTDATYHSAGDGKMVLATKRNDIKCHLNSTGYYDYLLSHDYPSVSQIRTIAMKNKFKIIFAVLDGVKETYDFLAKEVGAQRELLKGDAKSQSNIVDVIKEAYLASLRHMTIRYQLPVFVQVTLSRDCTRPQSEDCFVGHNEELKMTAKLKVVSCPKDALDYHQVLQLGPDGGGMQDKLEIDLEIQNCQCECETDKSGIPNSPKCTNSGTLQCGICICNINRSGPVCECDDSTVSTKADLDECKNVNDTMFCSGNGKCRCRTCTCYDGFSGKFCQFDDNSCIRKNNQLCSGHGKCTLGACKCDSELWGGEDCGCSKLDHDCYAPYSKETCSGRGKCVCNECVCDKIKGKEERYSGVFCEDCEECGEKRCHELEEYARCNFLTNKTYCDVAYNQTAKTEVQMVNKTEMNASKWPMAKWCSTKLDDERSIVFLHSYNKFSRKLLVVIQREAEEVPKADIWVPIGISIGSVILIGLLTVLIWKLVVDALDEREYNKFQKQALTEGFDVSDNPLYQPASVNFSNPTYNQ